MLFARWNRFLLLAVVVSLPVYAQGPKDPSPPSSAEPSCNEDFKVSELTYERLIKLEETLSHLSPASKRLQDIVQQSGIQATSLVQDIINKHDNNYTNLVCSGGGTNQYGTGRCWIFAGQKVLCNDLVETGDVPQDFEFSENYLWFFSFMEQANLYLNNSAAILTKDLLKIPERSDFIPRMSEGGTYHWFAELVEKYGLVPKEAMNETQGSVNGGDIADQINLMLVAVTTKMMQAVADFSKKYANSIATCTLEDQKSLTAEQKGACGVFAEDKKKLLETLAQQREQGESAVLQVLITSLGHPPRSFVWRHNERAAMNEKSVQVTPARQKKYTPVEFKEKIAVDMKKYVSVVSSPLKEYGKSYLLKDSGIVVDEDGKTREHLMLNVDIKRLKELVVASLDKSDPVWFAADVSKDVLTQRGVGIMHPGLFAYRDVYDGGPAAEVLDQFDYGVSRRQLLYLGNARPNHAMVFIGYDRPNPKGPIVKFAVENSWGAQVGVGGIYAMYDAWFNQYVYEIAVSRDLLTAKELELLEHPESVADDLF